MTGLKPPAWDAYGWHYCADAAVNGPLTAQYVAVLDALNFCFWPSKTGMEYDVLATTLKKLLETDADVFSAVRLQSLTPAALAAWFPQHDVPCVEERCTKLNELGTVLAASFGASALNLLKAARQSAVRLVNLLVSHFPGFRDEAVYNGRQVWAHVSCSAVWSHLLS
jgi:hypothetical protein